MAAMQMNGRLYIARHGETVYNVARRMQGHAPHSPLTRNGFLQADAMGRALAETRGDAGPIDLWASPAGRAVQTMAVMLEHLGGDFMALTTDERLREIDVGAWSDRPYSEIGAEIGDFLCMETGLFTVVAPEGEGYPEVAARVADWAAERADEPQDRLVVMHGMSSRVLRGLLLGIDPDPRFGVPIAPSVPQGSLVLIEGGAERLIRVGDGTTPD